MEPMVTCQGVTADGLDLEGDQQLCECCRDDEFDDKERPVCSVRSVKGAAPRSQAYWPWASAGPVPEGLR